MFEEEYPTVRKPSV